MEGPRMKTVILAGGAGTRLGEATESIPKPLIEIGGRPILWHIMSCYSHFGFNDFVVALGHKGTCIKRWFRDYCSQTRDMTLAVRTGDVLLHNGHASDPPDWRIDLINTGPRTETGGRIKRLARWVGDGTFMATYCDGLSDLDLDALLSYHRSHGKLATVTAVKPPSRFGHLVLERDRVVQFAEKPRDYDGWINGGFLVLEPGVLDYIEGDPTQLEREPLENLANDGQLRAFKHTGFWQCMDTVYEKRLLEGLWRTGEAPWKNGNPGWETDARTGDGS
jgi:glucose-1-phosphate cytidylyltransferase